VILSYLIPILIRLMLTKLLNPTSRKESFSMLASCAVILFLATITSALHCPMFPHPPPKNVFGQFVSFQDAKN
jgi:hypothetical protein